MEIKKTTVGLSVNFYGDLTPSKIIMGLRYLGVEFVEITRSVFSETEEVAKRLRGIRTAFHLPLVHEDGWDLSCSGFQKEIDETVSLINRHKKNLAIQHAIAHPPEAKASTLGHESSFDQLMSNLSRLELPVYLENIPTSDPELFLEQYHRARSRLGRQMAGICFDAAHYLLSNVNPVQQFNRLRENIGCIHLSDCDQREDKHLPFGQGGALPVADLFDALVKSRFLGYITLEMKPESPGEIDALLQSYLLTLRALRKDKFMRTKIRIALLRPFIKRAVT